MSNGQAGFPQGYLPDAPADAEQAASTEITDETPAAEAAMQAAESTVLESLGAVYISYYAAGGDTERRILALIMYLGPQKLDGIRGGSRPQYEILVRNDAAAGITAAELDTGTDKLQIPPRIARSAITVRIVNIVKQDKAMLLLRAW